MLAQDGCLEMLITDLWNPVAIDLPTWLSGHVPRPVSAFWARRRSDIPSCKVRSFGLRSFGWRLRQARARSLIAKQLSSDMTDAAFANAVVRYLDEVDHDIFFGYSGASLEAIRYERKNGRRTLVDQIDVSRKGKRILIEEEARHPDLSLDFGKAPESYFRRREEECVEADVVMVNSNWCRDAMVEQGVSAEKIRIVPLCFTPDANIRRSDRQRVLRVLWLGGLSLLKGIAYALEAAALLSNRPIEFTFAGPLAVRRSGLRFPSNVRYVGVVPRSNVSRLYMQNDVFLLPTLSDGFAITQVEAMAYGLPVIATRNCGDVVEDGVSGFHIQPRDSEAIKDAIDVFLDREVLESMTIAARRRAEDFLPERVSPLFLSAVRSSA